MSRTKDKELKMDENQDFSLTDLDDDVVVTPISKAKKTTSVVKEQVSKTYMKSPDTLKSIISPIEPNFMKKKERRNVKCNFLLTQSNSDKLKHLAQKNNTSMNDVLNQILSMFI